MTEEEIFQAAIAKSLGTERDQCLRAACGNDNDLRNRVEALLNAHAAPDSIFQQPPVAALIAKSSLPKQLGDFEIIRQIGRGGMGVVYEARQKSLNRRVALKVLSSGLGLSSKAVLRFRREAEAAARLHHTNIVPIYATGDDRGMHFYAMELVEGPSLDRVIQHLRELERGDATIRQPSSVDELPAWVHETIAFQQKSELPRSEPADEVLAAASSSSTLSSGSGYFDQVARMIADVADALDHAHDQGVIHRDIKPSNLLLAPDGRLSVNDFGLARMLEQPGMTMSGEFVGTPYYMSPEQIASGRAPLDHRTDIYSLGAALYELLTLQPPFLGRGRDEVIAKVMHKDPERPRRHNKRIPVDLETICLKCLEKDPDRRYQTAAQLAEDLRRYVNRYAISAKRIGPVGRAIKWARRNRAVSALLLMLVLVASVAGGLGYSSRLQRLRQIEDISDRVLLYVLSGEFDDAKAESRNAESLGASAAQLGLMQALIAVFDERFDDAILILERLELDSNTSAYAILTMAYQLAGDEMKHFQRLPRLVAMPARSYQDRLLKGLAEWGWLNELAVKDLEEAVRLRQTPLARLLLASASVEKAHELDGIDDQTAEQLIRTSLEEIQYVRSHFRPKKLPRAESDFVYAKMIEADLAGGPGLPHIPLQGEALDVAQQLQSWSDSSVLAFSTYVAFLHRDGRDEEVIAASAKPGKIADGIRGYRMTALFQLRRDAQAQATFVQIGSKTRTRIHSMMAIFHMSKPHANRDQISQSFQLDQEQFSLDEIDVYAYWDIVAYELLGERDRARSLGRGYHKQLKDLRYFDRWADCGEFASDEIDSATLLQRCSGTNTAKLHANFLVAIRCLADDDREGAKKHFQQAVDTNCHFLYAHWWAKAFLQRTDDDPNWLPWLRKLNIYAP